MIHAQATQSKKEKDAKITQLTQDAKLTDLIESPNGKWISFVKRSNYTIPSNCFYFFTKGQQADEVWIVNTDKMTKKLLVAPHFSCKNVSKVILDPHHLQFSPDSKTLFFKTSAWVVTGAIHAIDVNGSNLRFVTDGGKYHIIQNGPNKGNLIVNQHRYHNGGGSFDWDWLYTPTGKQIKVYKKED